MPKQVDHQARRQRLADTAAATIAAAGLEATNLRDVARAGGLTTGSVTHYFASKDELLTAAYEAMMARLAARQAAEPVPDDPAAIAPLLATYLPQDADSLAEWRVWLAFTARAVVDPALRTRHLGHYRRIIADLAAQLPGERATAGTRADVLVAMIDGLAIRIMLEPADWPAARVEATIAAALPLLTGDPP